MSKTPKTVYVKHSSRVEDDKRFETIDVYKPNNVITPFHTFDRSTAVEYLDDFNSAVESLVWIGSWAAGNMSKWKADKMELSSNIPLAAEMVTAIIGDAE